MSERTATEISLTKGTGVRAGGHLVFDSHKARYFLLARDVELVSLPAIEFSPPSEPYANGNGVHKTLGRQALTPILADIKRRAEAASLEEAEVPYWVKKLAPPEIREELAQLESVTITTAVSPQPAPLDDKLLSALSQAMDSDEEVELTPEMLAQLAPTAVPPPIPTVENNPYHIPSTAHKTPSNQANLTMAITILVFAIILLAILLTVLFSGF